MSENMKKHMIALILAAAFLIVVPILTVRNNAANDKNNDFISNKENNSDYLTEILANEFREEYCSEGLKAVGIILNSNYKSGEKIQSLNKSEFIKKYKNGEKYYSLIEKTADEIGDKCITYKGKAVKLPYYYTTNGNCDDEYSYLKNTANPWDLINKNYTYDSKPGISLNSLNELCKKGLSCEESLSRYLKDIKIEPPR